MKKYGFLSAAFFVLLLMVPMISLADVLPIPRFTCTTGLLTPRSGPAPLEVSCTDTSLNVPEFWFWTFGDGNTSTLRNPVNVYVRPGKYSVKLTVENDAGSANRTILNYITVSSCADFPVRLSREVSTPGCPVLTQDYANLQDAYDAACDGDVIKLLGIELPQTLTADQDLSVTLEGGYNCGYGRVVNDTILIGMISINRGILTIKDFTLQ